VRQSTNKLRLGNYLGIVIQNNDPEHRGRIKVFVPHVTPSVYEGWDKAIKDKSFKFIGDNIDSDLTAIVDDLKLLLPWTECAAPLVGATGSGRYNAREKVGTISDSAKPKDIQNTSADNIATKYSLNVEGIGEKPSRIYEVDDLKVNDAFSDTSGLGAPNRVNKHTFSYKPFSYSNSAKGSFSIPNVGSHVWVFFEGGDVQSPVYFAVSHGLEDWRAIYEATDTEDGIDYPNTYENKSLADDPTYNHNTETYRNKFVLNQKGGTLEIVNTDNREILRLTHFSGSFKEFNNYVTKDFAANDYNRLIQGDDFETIRGYKNTYVECDHDYIVRGDVYKKIGTFNKDAFSEWQEKVGELADIKQLFEIKRTNYEVNDTVQRQSPGQQKTGKTAPCPLCSRPSGRPFYWDVNNKKLTGLLETSISTVAPRSLIIFAGVKGNVGGLFNFDLKEPEKSPKDFLGSGNCPICNGTGLSPSSLEGEWDDQNKDKLIAAKLRSTISDLALIEKKLGMGGSEISHITKHKNEVIGLMFNDFPSVRIDPVGKMVNSEVKIFNEGVVTSFSTSPVIEYVHVDDMPGGSYNLTCNNRFNCVVGAGGIGMKSVGPVDISGTITNIAGDQVNIASDNEINITAGRVNIVADILNLRQKRYKQVLVDSNLGVSQNVVVGGSMHVEGELSVHHITAPTEIQETEATLAYGQLVGGTLIGRAIGRDCHNCMHSWPVYAVPTPMSLYTYDHQHLFKNLPLSLTQTSDDVRKAGSNNTEQNFKTPPTPVSHGPTGGGLYQIGETLS
jgi:hypothetical protein